VTTFYASIEPWIRGIREEDVGFLEYTGDEIEPYVMPKLGRHYLEVWEEEDVALYGAPLPGFSTGRNLQALSAPSNTHVSASAPQPKWDPSTLTEPDLITEDRGHGPLTERLISALLPMPDQTVWKGVKAAEDAMEGRPGGGPGAAARKERVNVGDLEERIRDTMRFHELLGGVVSVWKFCLSLGVRIDGVVFQPDYTEKVDDPIATALRHAQRKLRTVVATNKARKARLATIARDRLGYQEYLDLRESIDKNLCSTYSKQQKKDAPKVAKKKKKMVDLTGNTNGSADGTPVPPTPKVNPAALGLGPDDDNRLVVSEPLKQLVELRRQWVDAVGGVFDRKEREVPGSIWGIAQKTVFEGVEEEARLLLERGTTMGGDDGRTNSKGKGKANGNEMDVG
jgi:transcriptional adapter 3